MNRREVLRVGALTAFGLTLRDLVHAAPQNKRATGCILIWLDGGPSHLDTLDPKPEAAAEVRGPFGSIATRVPGVRLSEELPSLAGRLARCTIVRSLTSPLGEHNLGSHYVLTGYKPTPALVYPSFGAVLARVRSADSTLPSYVAVPDASSQAGAGFLPE